jgi:hypothetical protein
VEVSKFDIIKPQEINYDCIFNQIEGIKDENELMRELGFDDFDMDENSIVIAEDPRVFSAPTINEKKEN